MYRAPFEPFRGERRSSTSASAKRPTSTISGSSSSSGISASTWAASSSRPSSRRRSALTDIRRRRNSGSASEPSVAIASSTMTRPTSFCPRSARAPEETSTSSTCSARSSWEVSVWSIISMARSGRPNPRSQSASMARKERSPRRRRIARTSRSASS